MLGRSRRPIERSGAGEWRAGAASEHVAETIKRERGVESADSQKCLSAERLVVYTAHVRSHALALLRKYYIVKL